MRLLGLAGTLVAGLTALVISHSPGSPAYGATPTPITHVVVFYQENHTFDSILGAFCNSTSPPGCDGALSGRTSDGRVISLVQEPDLQPKILHTVASQNAAINGGQMNGFNSVVGCGAPTFACYVTEEQKGIPNTWALAANFAVSDRTFSLAPVPSWAAHIDLVTGLLDGFQGDTPAGSASRGWGCDSGLVAPWSSSGLPPYRLVPSCVPANAGSSAGRVEPPRIKRSPVQWVPTIMDSLSAAGETWKIYGNAYVWAVCPSFADCLYSSQRNNLVPTDQILSDAAAGTLPNFAILTPSGGISGPTSQHPPASMIVGDNWIGQVVSAIENGPNWKSTAIFLTYDDCGCFYDHVPPPTGSGLGLRMPMIIISPYAKRGYTDSTVASFASILAFSEHVLGLTPLNSVDANAYNYMGAFNFNQTPLPAVRMIRSREPASSRAYLARHPNDARDPT